MSKILTLLLVAGAIALPASAPSAQELLSTVRVAGGSAGDLCADAGTANAMAACQLPHVAGALTKAGGAAAATELSVSASSLVTAENGGLPVTTLTQSNFRDDFVLEGPEDAYIVYTVSASGSLISTNFDAGATVRWVLNATGLPFSSTGQSGSGNLSRPTDNAFGVFESAPAFVEAGETAVLELDLSTRVNARNDSEGAVDNAQVRIVDIRLTDRDGVAIDASGYSMTGTSGVNYLELPEPGVAARAMAALAALALLRAGRRRASAAPFSSAP